MNEAQDWVGAARLGRGLRVVGLGDALWAGFVSLKEPWGSGWAHTAVIALPLLLALTLMLRPSWGLACLSLLSTLSLAALSGWAFGKEGLDTAAAAFWPLLLLLPLLWQWRAHWREPDLSPHIRRLKQALAAAARDPERSIRFTLKAGGRRLRVRATRLPHCWFVRTEGPRRSGFIGLQRLQIELGFGGAMSCRFKGPGYLSYASGECQLEIADYHRFERLMRERP